MKPYVRKLQDEWYDTLDSLRGLSTDKWDALGFPARLVDIMKRKLDVDVSMAVAPSAATVPDVKMCHRMQVDFMPQNISDTAATNLEDEASKVAASVPREDLETAVQTLLKLTDAVLQNPELEKTRKIRKENANFHQRCGRFSSCIDFLVSLGFDNRDDVLFMEKAFISRLTDGRRSLERICKEASFTIPMPPESRAFNPYVASISSSSVTPAYPKGRLAEQRAQEEQRIKRELEEEKHNFEKQTSGTGMLTAPRVFWLASLGRLEDAVLAMQSSMENDDTNIQMEYLQSCMQASNATKFHSRQRDELEQLKKKRIYNAMILRVYFPNKIVLELNFRPKTPWIDVYDVVKSCLSEEAKSVSWYLFDTPPIRKFSPVRKETLFSSQLIPGGVVHFGLENREQDLSRLGKCINSELFMTLPPEPETNDAPSNNAGSGSFSKHGKTPAGGQTLC